MVNSEYLKNLNKAQKEAVMHLDGPLLIVAGDGSGKTKVLTSRIANIIKEKKAFPNQILAVTFTNKAAKEMQSRVIRILRSEATGLSWLGKALFSFIMFAILLVSTLVLPEPAPATINKGPSRYITASFCALFKFLRKSEFTI